jgi:hypothetical protein
MKKVLLIILLFVLYASNYAFGQPKDVEGWNKTRWGMTKNKVLKAFEGKATAIEKPKKYEGLSKQRDAYALVVLDEIEIGGDKYTVDFVFDDSDKKLIMVIISIKGKRPSELQFSSLEQMLTEKYGSPSFAKDTRKPDKRLRGGVVLEGSDLLERAWNFPSTIIELQYLDLRATNPKILQIKFRKNLKENRENI